MDILTNIPTFLIPIAIVFVVLLFSSSYIKAPPDKAYIISGLHKV